MSLGSSRPEIKIGLIDGSVELNSPNLVRERIREVPGKFLVYAARPIVRRVFTGLLWPVSYVQDGTLQLRRSVPDARWCVQSLRKRELLTVRCQARRQRSWRCFSTYPPGGRVKWDTLGGLVRFGGDMVCLRQNLN